MTAYTRKELIELVERYRIEFKSFKRKLRVAEKVLILAEEKLRVYGDHLSSIHRHRERKVTNLYGEYCGGLEHTDLTERIREARIIIRGKDKDER